MKKLNLFITSVLMLIASVTYANAGGFISVPAPAFSGIVDGGNLGYQGNDSGTARFFRTKIVAAVNLPHETTVTFFRCGGGAFFGKRVAFTLRRNEPQQANVDLATIKTSLNGTGFEFVSTTQIKSGNIHNGKFNYYIIAEIEDPNANPPTLPMCGARKCWVGFCTIGYVEIEKPIVGPAKK